MVREAHFFEDQPNPSLTKGAETINTGPPIRAQFRAVAMLNLQSTLEKMTDIMTEGEHVDDPEKFEEHGFVKGGIHELQADTPTGDAVLEGAKKILNTTRKRGEIKTDSAVENAVPIAQTLTSAKQHSTQYYMYTGPVAVRHPDLEWRTTYSLAEDAPEYNTEEWNRAASELSIPEGEDTLVKLVRGFWQHLEFCRDTDNRPAHAEELLYKAPAHVPSFKSDRAFRYLEQLPGVNPPEDGPAWVYVGDQE